uniref:hypothetical protein n=1 Tax=Polynucleobacter sp. TaxID=2029855 RepID=UPI0040484AF3
MFGLFKKKVDQNALIFIFLKIVGAELFSTGAISQQSFDSRLNEYLSKSNSQIATEQQLTIKSAIHIVLLDENMQKRILNLHKADEENTQKLFLEILDEFQSYGIFC